MSASIPSTTGGIDPTTQSAIDSMTAAFDTAIQTNAKITVIKTEKGAEETAAQQRPNIG